ncbi:MAG: cell division protein ZapA [Thermodesulfobacteriota bacterium]|nr:cell division protein ZapA [Thermodesulfobacteriota bacterium]
MQETISVKILGQEYIVKTGGRQAYVQALSGYIDEKVLDVQKAGSAASTMELVALVMLNMADDVAQAKTEMEGLKEKVNTEVKHLIKLIDKRIK